MMITLDQLSRVAVVGTSWAGKTTFARALSGELNVPHIELDTLHWGPNWTPHPLDDFRASVEQATGGPRWVCDGNYHTVRDLVWRRASAIVWLNYSFPLVFRRALGRTLHRCLRGTRLYTNNRETLPHAFFSRDSILLWILKTHWRRRWEYPTELAAPEHAHLSVYQFNAMAQTNRFLSEVRQIASGPNPGADSSR
jgi:adenylate kinase family enzyme